ncbi:MAG: hypothetical protein AAF634_03970 [Bacteroidota bacterium]
MEKEIVRHYEKGELTVVWKPKRGIRSEVYGKTLPEVYKPKEKPWIQPEHTTLAILKYTLKGETKVAETIMTACTIVENGPLFIRVNPHVVLADETVETMKRSTAFCNYGTSDHIPSCDGTYNPINFLG